MGRVTMRNRLSVLGVLAAVGGSATGAGAATLVAFNFDTYNTVTATFPSASNDAGVQPSAIGRGAGLNALGYLNNTFGAAGSSAYATDLAGAVTKNQYFGFTVTPATGNTVTINSVTALEYARNIGAVYTLESSATGFGSAAANALASATVSADSGTPASTTYNIATPIASSAPVEFRLYIYDIATGGSQFNERGLGKTGTTDGATDLAAIGTVATPEPAAASLLGVAGLLALRRRRRVARRRGAMSHACGRMSFLA